METKKVQKNLKSSDEIRIVLIGKTGVGKSAAANAILGKQKFKSELSASSVTSKCDKDKGNVNGQKVAIIDTPGFFDTKNKNTEIEAEIKLCISLSAPGPHIFLVVMQLGRFTEEEKHTVERIQKVFGEQASKYIMVLFTHGDQLKKQQKDIHDYVKESPDLYTFIKTTSGWYHVFDNIAKDQNQVNSLFEIIDQLVILNGKTHYTNNMLQEAEKAIEEEKVRLMVEKRMEEQAARYRAERNNAFLKAGLAVAGVGISVGVAIAARVCSCQ